MSDDEDLKEGLKKSMSEPAKKKKDNKPDPVDPYRNRSRETDTEWQSKFDRNRG